jgi:hypothetical protein
MHPMSKKLVFMLLPIALLGCEKKCLVPPGDYTMALTPRGGDCNPEVIAQFTSYSDTVTMPEGTECKRFLSTVDGEANGCKLIMDISAEVNATGFRDGEAIFRVSCPDNYACRHEFTVAFTRQNAP